MKRILSWTLLACFLIAGSLAAPAREAKAVFAGLDVIYANGFTRLEGRKIGLIVNHSSLTRQGVHSLDLLAAQPNVDVVGIFSPEHGIRGTEDVHVESGVDEKTGIPIHSLYGKTNRPTKEMLKGIDTLVFDIQDIGARFYTYIGTMGVCMEEAAKHGIKFIVLDRPNPIGGVYYDGPIQDEQYMGRLTSYAPMPIVHGMTVGEMARYFVEVKDIDVDLEIVEVENWRRDMFYDETGLPWVDPSPNMRSLMEEHLYTMVALVEANKDVSVGRGTERPFEYVGAPWVDSYKLASELRSRNIPGLWIMEMSFLPRRLNVTGRSNYPYPFVEQLCYGCRFVVNNRHAFKPVEAGIHMLDALKVTHPDKFSMEKLGGLVGAQWVLDDLKAGKSPEAIADKWRRMDEFKAFEKARKAALLYD